VKEKILGSIIGLCVADALGVPVEFKSREYLKENPVIDMIGYGTYNQPPGTWSDDTSMTLCLVASVAEKGKLCFVDIMDKYVSWMQKAEYTAHGKRFDIGITTRNSLMYYTQNRELYAQETGSIFIPGEALEGDNGNGSLMRILPCAFLINSLSFADWRLGGYGDWGIPGLISYISAMTHAHPRSCIACVIYVFIAERLIAGDDIKSATSKSLELVIAHYKNSGFASELEYFNKIGCGTFANTPEDEISSSGYVVHTLEAALWCLLNTDSYESCVLKAVNLGEDTDTVAAVAGGLAGIIYGIEGIPQKWLCQIPRLEYIMELCADYNQAIIKACCHYRQ